MRTAFSVRWMLQYSLLVWLVLPYSVASVKPSSPWGSSPSSSSSSSSKASTKTESDSSKWSSFLTVDPSKILSLLVKHGGLLIPKSTEKEIQILRQVLNVDKAELNVLERKLVLYNLTVQLPGDIESLRVGRVHVSWDSYLAPSIDIQVDQVDVSVEFTNLLLTRSNWNSLHDSGFPPTVTVSSDAGEGESPVRIHSIDLSHNLTVKVTSRPLKKKIGTFTLDLDVTDDVTKQIRRQSDRNLVQIGRRGCTTDEVAALLQRFIGRKITDFVADRVSDLAADPLGSVQDAGKRLADVGDTIRGYADDARKKKGEDIQLAVSKKLEVWGIDPNSISALREQSLGAFNRFNASVLKEKAEQARSIVEEAASRLQEAIVQDDPEPIMFPDW